MKKLSTLASVVLVSAGLIAAPLVHAAPGQQPAPHTQQVKQNQGKQKLNKKERKAQKKAAKAEKKKNKKAKKAHKGQKRHGAQQRG
ncbi:Flp pilus assembly protein TadB [Neisseria sp. HSC-16F19]|nr:hypothetical protein [Neisseria sp. HSC-16F19]MCP2041302.1 Flp pilus assembly protein TadB [Neisseria sp. HSC-16F19]